ncbi:MAG: acyl-CoA mutase large subunit family protein, partial [Muribaculaceae bacterium]|nr:acyl-CoA mutase large subunit family protein [Muribaculaceae bacterium]
MANNQEKLFDMFEPVSTEDWVAKINVDLKGADFNKKLVWRTNEGFNVMPFYRRSDLKELAHMGTVPGQFPYVRGTKDSNNWLIRQQIQGNSPEEVNSEARHAIDRGVDSIGIKLGRDITAEQLALVLQDIDLKKIEVNVSCCMGKAVEIARMLVAYLKEKGLENDFHGSIDFNPFKRLLRHGLDFPRDLKEEALAMYEAVKDVPNLKCYAVDSYMLNNAGAYIT